MNEIVKYRNEMNSISMTNFSAVDLDALMMLCAKLKERGTDVLTFHFSELKVLLGMPHESDDRLIRILKRMNMKLNRVNGHYENEDEIVDFNLFPTFRTLKKEKVLQVRANIDFMYLLNNLTNNFTRFELSEFVQLESKYSKNLYRLLKQYRRTGTYKVETEKFRDLMDCPKSYSNKIFMRDCVNVAIKELSNGYFKDLKVEPIRAKKRGAPIVAYTFTFRKSKDIPGQQGMDIIDQEPAATKSKSKGKNKFNNFPQREYDWEDLEGQLLK